MNWSDIAAAAATLFFVMDPLGNIPVFNAVLSRFPPRRSWTFSCKRSPPRGAARSSGARPRPFPADTRHERREPRARGDCARHRAIETVVLALRGPVRASVRDAGRDEAPIARIVHCVGARRELEARDAKVLQD